MEPNQRQPILVVYNDGSYERAEMPNAALRNIARQLEAEADNQVLPGTPPPKPVQPEPVVAEDAGLIGGG